MAFLHAEAKHKAARFAYPCKFIRLCMQKIALFVARTHSLVIVNKKGTDLAAANETSDHHRAFDGSGRGAGWFGQGWSPSGKLLC